MKRLLFAALAIAGFSTAVFSQAAPAVKKKEPSKMQVVNKPTEKNMKSNVVTMNKVTKPAMNAAVPKPTSANKKIMPAVTKPVAVTKTNATPMKKDGTPEKRFKANQSAAAGPLKKDGTADMRYKTNKKHG